jgi:hypothetical protein
MRSTVIALVLAAACWGAATVITKHVLTNIPSLTFLVLQLTISVSFLLIIVFAQRRDIVRLGGIAILQQSGPGLYLEHVDAPLCGRADSHPGPGLAHPA